MHNIDHLIAQASVNFDLTEAAHQASLTELTEKILELSEEQFDALIHQITAKEFPLEFKIALLLAESRKNLLDNDKPIKIGVVFAMWGEQNRLLPKSDINPNGEDSLVTKINQLEWACAGTMIDWHLYAVDDGCPYGSGELADSIIANHPKQDKVTVLYLEQALPTQSGPLKKLASADDSRKGGAIILGSDQAMKDGVDAVVYTDADNSVHLGQIGLLLAPYLSEDCKAVLGNRKDPRSVLVKQEARWGVGIKLLRHMQRMVGHSIFETGILDTQAAFKLYDSEALSTIIADPSVYDFSFDSDWIAALLRTNISFTTVPFAFIDSAAESASITQGPMTTWETLLLGLVQAVRHRQLAHHEEMAAVMEEEIKSAADLDLLINHLPAQLENVQDDMLGDAKIMSPMEVQEWIRLRKSEH